MKLRPYCVIKQVSGFNFLVSDSLISSINHLIQSKVCNHILFPEEEPQWELGIWIILSRDTTKIQIKRRASNRKSKVIDYYLWLPVDKFSQSISISRSTDEWWIQKTSNYTFLNLYFDALVLMSEHEKKKGRKFDISQATLREVQREVEISMINSQQIMKIEQ